MSNHIFSNLFGIVIKNTIVITEKTCLNYACQNINKRKRFLLRILWTCLLNLFNYFLKNIFVMK